MYVVAGDARPRVVVSRLYLRDAWPAFRTDAPPR
jgi:hypothetical protein